MRCARAARRGRRHTARRSDARSARSIRAQPAHDRGASWSARRPGRRRATYRHAHPAVALAGRGRGRSGSDIRRGGRRRFTRGRIRDLTVGARPKRGANPLVVSCRVNRRAFLLSLAAGTVAVVALHERGTAEAKKDKPRPSAAKSPSPSATRRPLERIQSGTPQLTQAMPPRLLYGLPAVGNTVALTIDDGVSSDVVAAYLDFIQRTGVRVTFFPNGVYPSWTQHAPTLRPLVDSGQVQLGNHTWSHPDLVTLSDSAVVDKLSRNEKFLWNTFG